MTAENLFRIILTAVSYYFFSKEFFKFSSEIEDTKLTYSQRFVCFFFIYLWFLFASYLELPLVVNWSVFLIMLGLEVHAVFPFSFLMSYGLSLFCILMGLTVNIFFRSLFAILLNQPLNIFDNVGYGLKVYPTLTGFVVMALLLRMLRRIHFPLKLKQLLHYKESLIFYTWTEVFIYLFLMAQLLAFSQPNNEIGMKTWGLKSALFSIVVLAITIIYSLRVASLNYYMNKQHETHNQLIQEKDDINKLWRLAYTDMLTGFSNRLLLDKRLQEYAGYGGSITLAFIDVNGLKIINDQYGHMEGDNYLINVSQILSNVSHGLNIDLFRYGGDEFVMMSNTLQEEELLDLLSHVNELLKSKPAQYSPSISYGVVHGDCADYEKLITAADTIMYQHKMHYYESTARS